MSTAQSPTARKGAALVLAVLCLGQFLINLDNTAMNVSMAAISADLDTPITGIQTAVTMYTLVMATLMITGGRVGSILGHRRAFGLGLLIFGVGSLVAALSPNLAVLIFGWSILKGLGAALILPSIVALVAANFPAEKRPAAYGMIAALGGLAVAVGPLLGGAITTYLSWRVMFAAEMLVVAAILLVLRRITDVAPQRTSLDLVGALLSATGLGLVVFGVLRTSEWGWIHPRPRGTELLGVSPSLWLIGAGLIVIAVFLWWQRRLARRGGHPLLDPALLRNSRLTGALTVFFTQYALQAGVFFAVPLFLTVVLELNALASGLRVLPLSLALLVSAICIPRLWPKANPRLVVQCGLLAMLGSITLLAVGMDPGTGAGVVTIPLTLMGLGLGALASQLGAVAVAAVPEERSSEVGGLQNTATNLGASLGTALIGSVLIATLSSSALAGIEQHPSISAGMKRYAHVDLAAGVPFLSDTAVRTGMTAAGADPATTEAVVEVNTEARLEALQRAFWVAAALAVIALIASLRLPTRSGAAPVPAPRSGSERSSSS